MHDGIDFVLGENGFELRAIPQVGLAKDCGGRNSGAVAFEQTIQSDDAHSAREQDFGTDAADVACCSGNENIQRCVLLKQGVAQDRCCSSMRDETTRSAHLYWTLKLEIRKD
jgi:hypothetical protein